MNIILGILSGGSGTRLWPLSRKRFPKQFHDLAGTGNPLLVDTIDRLMPLGKPVILTGEHLRAPTMTMLHRMGRSDLDLVIEPAAKDTAPAIALLTKQALDEDADAIVGIFPADHAITDVEGFRKTIQKAIDVAGRNRAIVTVGIKPNHPATNYGYIKTNGDGDALQVKSFIEKPDLAKAEDLIRDEHVFWNAGIFIFPAKKMADLFKEHAPEIWNGIEAGQNWDEMPSISIDYAVMEKANDLLCVPAEFDWTDLGSWEEIALRRGSSDTLIGIESKGAVFRHLHPMQKTAVIVGVDDVIVIDTPDALLVMKSGEGQTLKKAGAELKEKSDAQLHEHRFEERPWGRFEVLLDTDNFKSKRLVLFPEKQFSYQRHARRKEHWTIVKGSARVRLDDEWTDLNAGDSVTIEKGQKHQLYNPSKTEMLEVIEVQTGDYFGEDDIERFEDDFGRA